MVTYIVRRVLISIPLVLALVAVVFLLLRTLVPGDPALMLARRDGLAGAHRADPRPAGTG